MPKPQNFTADFADEMKLSKATVSRLAKQMIKAGKIIKKIAPAITQRNASRGGKARTT